MDWEARLTDAMSGPAKRMAAALGGLENALQRADKAAGMPGLERASSRLQRASQGVARAELLRARAHEQAERLRQRAAANLRRADGAGGGGGGLVESLSTAVSASPWGAVAKGIAMVTAAALAASMAVAQLGAAFTKSVLEAVDFRRGTIAALEVLQKSTGAARETYEVGIKLASRFYFDPQETVGQMQKMVSKGFSTSDANIMLTALADLKVLAPDANMDALTLAIGQIKGKAALSMEELNGQIGEAGLPAAKVLEQIAKRMGKSVAQIQKDISAGKVSGQEGLYGIVAAIKEMGTGRLGELAENAARKSLGGLVRGIQTNMGLARLALAKGLDGSEGVDAAMRTLANIVDALNPEKSPGMNRAINAATGFADTLFRVLFGATASKGAKDTMGAVLDQIGAGIEAVTAVVRVVGPLVADVVGGMVEGFGEVYAAVKSAAAGVLEALGPDIAARLGGAGGMARLLGKGLAYAAVAATVVVGALAGLAAAIVGVVAGGTAMLASFFSPFLAIAPMVKAAFYGVEQTVLSLPGRVQVAGASFVEAFFGMVRAGLQRLGAFVDLAVGWVAALPGRMSEKLASTSLASAALSLGGDLLSAGIELGSNLWQGFVQGIENGIVRVLDAGTRLANAAKSAVGGALRIESPSRVMAEMGGYTAAGFAQGVEGGAGQVDAAMTNLVTPPAPVLGRGGSVTSNTLAAGGISVTINVQGAEGAAQPGAMASEVRTAVSEALEGMLAQMGLTPSPQGA